MVNGKWLSASMSCIPYGNVGVLCLEVRVRVSNYKWPVLWRGWLMQILWGWHHNAVNKCISPAINLFRDVLYSSVWEILAQSHFKVWTLPLVFQWTQQSYKGCRWTLPVCHLYDQTFHVLLWQSLYYHNAIYRHFYGDRKAWMLTVCSPLHIINPAIK